MDTFSTLTHLSYSLTIVSYYFPELKQRPILSMNLVTMNDSEFSQFFKIETFLVTISSLKKRETVLQAMSLLLIF